eukprot:scaffold367012_cov33-Prasinocladus_malaysianus.AAC.1
MPLEMITKQSGSAPRTGSTSPACHSLLELEDVEDEARQFSGCQYEYRPPITPGLKTPRRCSLPSEISPAPWSRMYP